MEFALNYSPQAAALLDQGRIQIDRFKCPDWADVITAAAALRPVYVHFPLIAGDNSLADADWDGIERLLSDTDTPFLNLHLAPRMDDYPELLLDPLATNRVVSQMADDVWQAVKRVGAERVIVENVPYLGDTDDDAFVRVATDAAVMRQIIVETGCGLLLDLAHARLTAWFLGMDAVDYIASLPVRALRELHVAGIHLIDDKPVEHQSLTEDDWAYMDWAMHQIDAGVWAAPRTVAFEYGGIGPRFEWRSDPAVIEAQVPPLVEMVRAVRV